MKLSKFIKQCEKLYPGTDPELYILGDGISPERIFSDIELLKKQDYYEESNLGSPLPKYDFICIEPDGEIIE